MTEREMTEAEIMKAFECCKEYRCRGKHCPFYEYGDCKERLDVLKIDFIKRKNAEIEVLQKAIQVQEIMLGNQDYAIKKAKAEAIKEFAERVKEKKRVWEDNGYWIEYIPFNEIDQIAKGMGG